jgi:4-amino-4-deoxy-L-arabinose transferase-like glycosyltransferase
MLTYSKNIKLKRIDLPWLLVMLVFIWVLGTAFFHSPWEPYELFVFAVVKGIIYNHSWLVPVVSGVPYPEIQPFYFWIYSSIIKLFNII